MFKNNLILTKSLLSNIQMIRLRPCINRFLFQYIRKFKLLNVGGQLVIHSHLPSINSKAYTRFINEHLLAKTEGPSHAQIALTNACPQHCQYCYNKNRSGEVMDTNMIIRIVQELKESGVMWLGLTGGEPLLNKDLVKIVQRAGPNCAIKLFTTGYNLTEQLAGDLKKAGLLYVSVSLDHYEEEEHDKIRGCSGAFRAALAAIDILKKVGGIHISVSTVISKEMIHTQRLETFIEFLAGLDIHEVWLTSPKASIYTILFPALHPKFSRPSKCPR